MIGKNLIITRSLVHYFYSGGDDADAEAEFQPPSGGCWARCDAGSGGSGSIVISGTYGGEDVEETLETFDSDGIAIGTQRFATITNIAISLTEGTSSVIIYPATETGDIINLTTYTESYMRCNWEYTSSKSENRIEVDVGGVMVNAEIMIRYNKNQNIRRDDLMYIDGAWFRVGIIQTASRATRLAYLINTGEVV